MVPEPSVCLGRSEPDTDHALPSDGVGDRRTDLPRARCAADNRASAVRRAAPSRSPAAPHRPPASAQGAPASLIPWLALGLGTLRMPNSPRWLVMRNRAADAKNVLVKIRGTEEVDTELQSIETSLRDEGSSNWSDLLKPSLRLPLVIGICIAILQQITGITVPPAP